MDEQLGAVKATYVSSRWFLIQQVLPLAFLMTAAAAGLAFISDRFADPTAYTGLARLLLFAAAFILGIRFLIPKTQVTLHEHGFVYRRARVNGTVVWPDIARIAEWRRGIDGPITELTVHTSDGKHYALFRDLIGHEELFAELRRRSPSEEFAT